MLECSENILTLPLQVDGRVYERGVVVRWISDLKREDEDTASSTTSTEQIGGRRLSHLTTPVLTVLSDVLL